MINPRSNILRIKTYIPGKPIEMLKDELGIVGEIYKYNSNENPLGPSKKAKAAITLTSRPFSRTRDAVRDPVSGLMSEDYWRDTFPEYFFYLKKRQYPITFIYL